MSYTPFFSILIPTRNRSHLVGHAIKSVLAQKFNDFEIIVSDNSNDNGKTKLVVDGFNDPRIRYVKADNLSMADNWEYCLAYAEGEFVTVLEDKQALYPHALETVYSLISTKDDCEAVGWLSDRLDDTLDPILLRRRKFSGGLIVWKSEDIIRSFMEDAPGFLTVMPRMINSCVSMRCIKEIKARSKMQRFFIEVSPDICAAFMQLAVLARYYFIDAPLNVIGGISLSNGVQGQRNRKVAHDFLSSNIANVCKYVEIKAPYLAFNMIINDYYRCRENIGGRLAKIEPKPSHYARWVLHDIGYQLGWGVDVRLEIKMWRKFISNLGWSSRLRLCSIFLLFILRAKLTKRMSPKVKSFALIILNREQNLTGYQTVEDVVHSHRLIVVPKI